MRFCTCLSTDAALGLWLVLGDWPQNVSSLSCMVSTATLPLTIAPRRPLPSGRASSQYPAGRLYQSLFRLSSTGGAAGRSAAVVKVVRYSLSHMLPARSVNELAGIMNVYDVDRLSSSKGNDAFVLLIAGAMLCAVPVALLVSMADALSLSTMLSLKSIVTFPEGTTPVSPSAGVMLTSSGPWKSSARMLTYFRL